MSEPMTDEELTALRSWYVNEKASWTRVHDVQLMPSYPWVRYFDALLGELDRLRAENAALRAIVREVARCSVYHDSQGGMLIVRDPDMMVERARALVGGEG